jgi:hypothetical protein
MVREREMRDPAAGVLVKLAAEDRRLHALAAVVGRGISCRRSFGERRHVTPTTVQTGSFSPSAAGRGSGD